MSEQIQISAEDLATMQKMKANIDAAMSRIGQMEFQKTKLVANLNEYQIGSEKFIADLIEKYGLPKDKRIEIDEKGFVSFAGSDPVQGEPN